VAHCGRTATVRLAKHRPATGSPARPRPCSDAQDKPATAGFVQTIRPCHTPGPRNARHTGAPIDVDVDPTGPPAPLRCRNDVLAYVAALLDTAATNLSAGGTTFPFALPPGFAGFDTPGSSASSTAGWRQSDVYLAFRGYETSGLSVQSTPPTSIRPGGLDQARFMMQTDQLDVGAAHSYSTATGDALNGL